MARQRRPQHRTPVAGQTLEELRRQVEILSDEVAALQRAGEATITVPEVDTRQPEVDLSRSVTQVQREIRRLDMHRQTMQRDLYDVVRQVWVAEVYDTYLLARPATVMADTGGLSMTDASAALVVARAPNQQYSVGDLVRVVRVPERLGVQADDGRDCLYMALSSNEYCGPFAGRIINDGASLSVGYQGTGSESYASIGAVSAELGEIGWTPPEGATGDYYIYWDLAVVFHETGVLDAGYEYAYQPRLSAVARYSTSYPTYRPAEAANGYHTDDFPGMVRDVSNRHYVVLGKATVADGVITDWEQHQYGHIKLDYAQPFLFFAHNHTLDWPMTEFRIGAVSRRTFYATPNIGYPYVRVSPPLSLTSTISGEDGRIWLTKQTGEAEWEVHLNGDVPSGLEHKVLIGHCELTFTEELEGVVPGQFYWPYVSTMVEYGLPIDLSIYEHEHPEP